MMYINYTAHESPNTLEGAIPATPAMVKTFENDTYDRCGKYSYYIPAFTMIDNDIIFYADGPWEC